MHELTEAFFRSLYSPALADADLLQAAQVTLWTMPDKKSYHLPLKDLAAVAKKAIELDAEGKDVYFGVALRKPGLDAWHRGTKEDLGAVTAMWLDIDIKDDAAHAAKDLPATTDDAIDIASVGYEIPSAIVHSGHGLHAYWFLKEPESLLTSTDVTLFETALAMLQQKARDYAAKRGWHLDFTGNADRVLRVPGTTNRKAA